MAEVPTPPPQREIVSGTSFSAVARTVPPPTQIAELGTSLAFVVRTPPPPQAALAPLIALVQVDAVPPPPPMRQVVLRSVVSVTVTLPPPTKIPVVDVVAAGRGNRYSCRTRLMKGRHESPDISDRLGGSEAAGTCGDDDGSEAWKRTRVRKPR